MDWRTEAMSRQEGFSSPLRENAVLQSIDAAVFALRQSS